MPLLAQLVAHSRHPSLPLSCVALQASRCVGEVLRMLCGASFLSRVGVWTARAEALLAAGSPQASELRRRTASGSWMLAQSSTEDRCRHPFST